MQKDKKLRSGILVCFIGIDGSGKSTLSKALIERIKDHGLEMEYVWCKFESSLFKLLILIKNKFFIRESNWKKNYAQSRELKKNLFKKRFFSNLYEWFILIDYRLRIIRKVTIPLIFGRNLVCDRYIYDTVVDMAIDLNYSDDKIKNLTKQLFYFSPKPILVFWIDLPEEVAFNRKIDVPSINFLKEKRNIYAKIGELFEVIALDGTKSLEELNDKVEKDIIEMLNYRRGSRYE